MPLNSTGHKVMEEMMARYGPKKGKSVFYAKENKDAKFAHAMKMENGGKFIAGAIKHPGRLTAAAERSGRSVAEQARNWANSDDASKRGAANLYENVLSKANRRGAATKTLPGLDRKP